jgi:hypothetical protein
VRAAEHCPVCILQARGGGAIPGFALANDRTFLRLLTPLAVELVPALSRLPVYTIRYGESLLYLYTAILIAIMPPARNSHITEPLSPYATRLWTIDGARDFLLGSLRRTPPPPLTPLSPRSLWTLAHQHHRHVVRRGDCCSSALARAAGRMLLARGADRLLDLPLLLLLSTQPPDLDGHLPPLRVDAIR